MIGNNGKGADANLGKTHIEYAHPIPEGWIDALRIFDGRPRLMIIQNDDGRFTFSSMGLVDVREIIAYYNSAGAGIAMLVLENLGMKEQTDVDAEVATEANRGDGATGAPGLDPQPPGR